MVRVKKYTIEYMVEVAKKVNKLNWMDLHVICGEYRLIPPSTYHHTVTQLQEKAFRYFLKNKMLAELEKQIEFRNKLKDSIQ